MEGWWAGCCGIIKDVHGKKVGKGGDGAVAKEGSQGLAICDAVG
jgi:hypothetical protein